LNQSSKGFDGFSFLNAALKSSMFDGDKFGRPAMKPILISPDRKYVSPSSASMVVTSLA